MNKTASPPRKGSKRRGKKHATVACTSCKQKRSKCDEGSPCSNCVRRSIRCVYKQGLDGRRKDYRIQAVEELQVEVNELETLLDLFRAADTNTVLLLIHSIRRGSPVSETLNRLQSIPRVRGGEAKTPEGEDHEVMASSIDHAEQFESALQHHARLDKASNTARQRRESSQSTHRSPIAVAGIVREESQSTSQSSSNTSDHGSSSCNSLQSFASASTLSSDADLFKFFEAPHESAPYLLHHHRYIPGVSQPLKSRSTYPLSAHLPLEPFHHVLDPHGYLHLIESQGL